MRVQGEFRVSREKDVQNMKARSQDLSPCCLIKRGPNWVGVGGPGGRVQAFQDV